MNKPIGIFVKLVSEVFMRWKNWRESKNYESMIFEEEGLIENQDTINELTARFHELQKEVYCMNDSRFLGCRVSSQWTVTRSQSTFVISILSWSRMIANSQGMETFLQIHERLLRHFLQENSILDFLRKTHLYLQVREDPLHVVNFKFQTQSWIRDRHPEIHSILRREDSQRNYGAKPTTTADFRPSFWQILFASNVRLLEDKIQDRGMHLITFFTEGMHWIRQVEVVD